MKVFRGRDPGSLIQLTTANELPKLLHSVNPKLYEVLQPFTWTLSNGPLHAQGGATLYVKVWKNDKGEFHIVHVEQRNPGSQSQNI